MPGQLLTPARRPGQWVPSVERALRTLEELARQPAGAPPSHRYGAAATTAAKIVIATRSRGERDSHSLRRRSFMMHAP